ncbi:electron transport complex subunit RsxB [Rhodoferax sp.]|uniref:electron transport complex subunit RsxB n=1 Tax=Rhodoferax sp. TaxID=50421 RepID=UPI0019F1A357|nr:electron transport complex subunit RsxB [Rhodoferax sp.]MBE0475267.1 electron transport complex subunit RsxB [Rhodoferax sp.]
MKPDTAELLAVLPQTQCTRCGYPDCAGYAQALHEDSADINQCPPGGAEGVRRLAALTGRAAKPLNPDNGLEAPRTVVFIDETWCIGCTLCIKACPVDAIVGANKLMHTVIERYCTGCELCLPVCPVDCIDIEIVSGEATGWAAWSPAQAEQARQRYEFHSQKSQREALENAQRLQAKAELKLSDLATHSQHTDPVVLDKKRAVIEAALARARAKRQATP